MNRVSYRWADSLLCKYRTASKQDHLISRIIVSGQERFTSMTRVYYKNSAGCVLMFDVTDRQSFHNTVKWKRDLDNKVSLPDGNPIPCILLANKV